MGLVMGVTAVLLGVAAALLAVMVWTALIFPRPAARARRALESRPGRSFLLGCVLVALVGWPVRALLGSAHGIEKLAGWSLAFPLFALLAIGMTAMAQLLSERLQPLSPAMTPLAGLVRGAVILEFSMALPVFGWFVFAPIMALTLMGAGALGVLSRAGQGEPHTLPAERQPARGEEPSVASLEPVPGVENPVSLLPETWRRAPDTAAEGAA
jgi:hypothetical protein